MKIEFLELLVMKIQFAVNSKRRFNISISHDASNIYVVPVEKLFLEGLPLRKTEAATRGVQSKKVLLKITQNSQENSCTKVSFLIKL